MRHIDRGHETFTLHDDGRISRPAISMGPSGKWRVVCAVTRNNLGGVTHRYTLAEILANPAAIPWKFKNGTQRTFIQDLDHGTMREWRSPGYRVY